MFESSTRAATRLHERWESEVRGECNMAAAVWARHSGCIQSNEVRTAEDEPKPELTAVAADDAQRRHQELAGILERALASQRMHIGVVFLVMFVHGLRMMREKGGSASSATARHSLHHTHLQQQSMRDNDSRHGGGVTAAP